MTSDTIPDSFGGGLEPSDASEEEWLDEVERRVQRCITHIMGNADAVQVFVTKYHRKSGYTSTLAKGDGNWHSRMNVARQWIKRQDAQDLDEMREDD